MDMRRGREFYSKNYDKVMEMHRSGMSINDIANHLGLSYSCIYHWIKGLRKPDTGNVNDFEAFLAKRGPVPVAEVKERFPKHNEIFLTASRRGLSIKRYSLGRKFGEYSTWYFISGQEQELKKRLTALFAKYKEVKIKLANMIGG